MRVVLNQGLRVQTDDLLPNSTLCFRECIPPCFVLEQVMHYDDVCLRSHRWKRRVRASRLSGSSSDTDVEEGSTTHATQGTTDDDHCWEVGLGSLRLQYHNIPVVPDDNISRKY